MNGVPHVQLLFSISMFLYFFDLLMSFCTIKISIFMLIDQPLDSTIFDT